MEWRCFPRPPIRRSHNELGLKILSSLHPQPLPLQTGKKKKNNNTC
uniref:Uncharacterized protein n=1 Tax=Nelumbo nucifera TaxID=4432 RepID=A0A822YL55_NELNU|nr:TPA_asm: hypothetical protein HUJ06_012088 [Nelumbo nucifera]